ncbi:P-loop containing nucleoside triphosphate hydrolase protein [Pholiota conissans]|uniref:P-loop containing nucleoside triphosphate hydrolase protein n=1 Tax=Pholiota conissans TaxID=109636 RepID=A0A9P5ZEY9_9AGAR|nr:P-loop containing nucleoside triphosphate hydrolase protein [Pholiota conissans]
MSMFVSTGLLSNTLAGSLQPKDALEFGVANGLLNPSSSHSQGTTRTSSQATLEHSPISTPSVPDLDPQSLEMNFGSTFLSNGLLLASASHNKASQNDNLDSEDFELPTVTEAFDITPGPETPSRLSTTTPIHIPRSNVRATTFDGKTIYIRRKPKIFDPAPRAASSLSARTIGNLLNVPIHRLLDQLSMTTAANLARADQEALSHSSETTTPTRDTLWVDRYRPQKFMDLVGNEKVARDAMTWLKEWDFCVFGKSKGKKRSRDGEENLNTDEFRRPKEKILLLSGPPGLGKTTLAHVVAQQAGYEVMEINASDARTGSIIDDRIRPALESGSAIGSTKPVLLVIDEVDGATGAGDSSSTFVHKLVQLILAKPRRKGRSTHNKGHNARPLLRPIICICNDHNASSLAKLRPHTYQIRFNRPADIHLVKRLKDICTIEGMKADARALSTLVGAARGDLRGCLNALQFVKTRGKDVTELVIRKATAGMKETDSTVTSVLNNLFSPLSKKRVREMGLTDEDEARYVGRLSHEVGGAGRDTAIASGCFGHYATMRRHDANLSRHEKGIEWLTTFDQFSSAMYSDGDFALIQYLPYTVVPFYPLFHERSGEKVERNQADWEHMTVTRSNEEILKSLSRCLRNATIRHGGDFRHLLSHPILQTEFAPYINRIISPPLRPVNSQVIRPQEKALMNRLVDIMASLELRFVQEKSEDGTLSYRLDPPPIDVFVTYDGKRASDITVSRYAVRHLVSLEVDNRLISRDTEFVEKGKRGKHDFFGKPSTKEDTDGEAEYPNKKAKLDTRDIADKPPTDFFGRLITIQSASSTKAADRKNVERRYRVSYKFLEGNSAAVRKPVKVNIFL